MSSGRNLLELPFKGGKKNGGRSLADASTSNGSSSRTPMFDCNDDEGAEDINSNLTDSKELSSRVTFSEESVAIGGLQADGLEHIVHVAPDEHRDGWDNKTQFFLGVISYAVGFGNVWRFPALLQKNGGGAFLIPYLLMMVLEGIPLFLIELGIGQRLQTGPVGVWNAIHPYLGGVGVSAAIVSYLVGLYYNVILTWVIYYLFKSFRVTLPWSSCPTYENGTEVRECAMSTSPTNYFWNREAIDTSNSIGETNGFTVHITICLILAWILIYFCVMRGIKTSGKLSRLWDPEVWLEASAQLFYSFGLGFGGLIAFSSYNPVKNNCKRDCIMLSIANLLTSLYTALVIFCVLGYMGHKNYMSCIDKDMAKAVMLYPNDYHSLADLKTKISVEEYIKWTELKFHGSVIDKMAEKSEYCSYHRIIEQAAEGTGLAFVVFTEAILQFPLPPIWSVLFFLMLLMLGLGSMFGTLEGVITSLNDSKMIRVKKPVMTAFLCGSACIIGLIFSTKSGQYWVSLFDHFAGTYALMGVAFFEIVAVIYVYGFRRFCRDLEYMTGEKIGNYWLITWRFISPTIMLVLFTCSVFKSFTSTPQYLAYNSETTHQHKVDYPTWALFIAGGLVVLAMSPVPFVYFVRKFKIWTAEGDIPAASKCLGSTPSTTYMLKSQMSFNRMVESNASEIQNIGLSVRNDQSKSNGMNSSKSGVSKNTGVTQPKGLVSSNKDKSSSENINSTALAPIKENVPTKEIKNSVQTRNRRKLSTEK